jgi:3-dehydroquinate dehydratase/shikimate dehydrogenase
MLFASLSSTDIPLLKEISVDGFEIRIDLLSEIDLSKIKHFIENTSLPTLLTLRSTSHGGKWTQQREPLLEKLLTLSPHFFDLESDLNPTFLKSVIQNYPHIKFILSHHHFDKPLKNLHEMEKYPVSFYKIAIFCKSTEETLRSLLSFPKKTNLSLICMGENGTFSRIIAPLLNNPMNYAPLEPEQKTAPGQISLKDLIEIYNYPNLNNQTQLYGLIGTPTAQSLGHIYHNRFFQKHHLNAVYVKMDVEPNELSSFFKWIRKLPLKGLSVTMPLKEKVIPFVDEIDDTANKIGAVNTLLFKENKIWGTNTDGIGALDPIEKRGAVKNKTIVLLGAGGAAKAIAWEAKKRGAHLVILNRTISKAKQLADSTGAVWGKLSDIPKEYDILIQCTPNPMPIDSSKILPSSLVMDTVYNPRETLFLQAAKRLGSPIIYGEEMFETQANAQLAFWKVCTT